MPLTRFASLVLAATELACGGGGGDDDGGTTAPPPPPANNQTLGSITTNVTTMNVPAGSTQTIIVSAFDTQNAIISNPGLPTFTLTNTAVAQVDNQGAVLGLTSGSTTLNVGLTRGGITKSATVTVNVTGALPSNAAIAAGIDAAFTPTRVAIARGGSVTWNFASLEHTVAFAAIAGAPSGISSGGLNAAISRTFGTAGNFSFTCTIHAGMNGEVIVR